MTLHYNFSNPHCHLTFDPGQDDFWQTRRTSALMLKAKNMLCVQNGVGMVIVLQLWSTSIGLFFVSFYPKVEVHIEINSHALFRIKSFREWLQGMFMLKKLQILNVSSLAFINSIYNCTTV